MAKKPASKTTLCLLVLLVWSVHWGIQVVGTILENRRIGAENGKVGLLLADWFTRNEVTRLISAWLFPAVILGVLAWYFHHNDKQKDQ